MSSVRPGCRLLTRSEFGFKTDLMEQWARLFALTSTPYMIIYALPGSGKTTFQHAMQRKGIPCSDTDDTSDENRMRRAFKRELASKGIKLTASAWAGSEVQKLKDQQFWEHDAAWRYALTAFPNMVRLTVTNLHNYALKESQKLGVTVVVVQLDKDVYLDRARGREDLSIYPLSTWYDDALGVSLFVGHVTASDFDELMDLGTTHITGFGSRNTKLFKIEPPDDDYDTRRAIGRMLRDNILLWGRVQDIGLHFIGSEVETPEMLRRFGMRAKVSGLCDQPYGLENNPFLTIGGSSSRESMGQKKLFAVDFPFATANCTYVIAIGGSPGEHWIDLMGSGYEKSLVVYDTVEPTYPKAIWVRRFMGRKLDIHSKYTSSNFVLLSDIRRDGHDDEAVDLDNRMQFEWVKELMKMPTCVGISLKFRPGHNSKTFRMPSNFDCVFQPWNAGSSRETRLFWKPEKGRQYTMVEMDSAKYFRALEQWNTARERNPDLETRQERLLATYMVERHDYVSEPVIGGHVTVGLYTISNNRSVDEVRGLIKKFIDSQNKFIFLLPFKPIYDTLVSADDVVVITGQGGNDSTFTPNDLLDLEVRCYSIPDWITQMDYGWEDRPVYCNVNLFPSPCCGGSPYLKEWFVVTNLTVPRSGEAQTWLNNQTWVTKFVTAKLRDVFGHTNSSLHKLRRDVIVEAGGVAIDDHRVNGLLIIDGHIMYVAVSGHLINILLASRLFPIDLPRWVGTIRCNLESCYTKRGRVAWQALWDQGVLAEDGQKHTSPQLFHSYYDFFYAIPATRKMASQFGFIIDERALEYLQTQLDILLASFPRWRYSQSFLADEYSRDNPG